MLDAIDAIWRILPLMLMVLPATPFVAFVIVPPDTFALAFDVSVAVLSFVTEDTTKKYVTPFATIVIESPGYKPLAVP